jgi:hypothetical protein
VAEDCPVVIPSMGRSMRVLTTRALPPDLVTLCVPEKEAKEYREWNYGVDVVGHPDEIVGLAEKRNWICARWGDVFMVDDDCPTMVRRNTEKGTPGNIAPALAWDLIQGTYRMALQARDELGVYLWGFAANSDRRWYKPEQPFGITGYVNGEATGLLAGSKLFWSAEVVAVEDFWISALNAYQHRMCWTDQRFGFHQKDTFHSVGGLARYRTSETERHDNEVLRTYFGRDVIRMKKGTQMAGLSHEHQRSLHLPF